MPVEMIGREIKHHADSRVQRWRKINLVTRTFNHMHPLNRGWREIENRGADIASQSDIAPRHLKQMRNQCGCR